MNRYLRLSFALVLGFILTGAFAADPKTPKSPGDLAADTFFELRDKKDVKLTPERQTKILNTGLAFLKEHPDHSRANEVITSLATFGATMKDKKQAPERVAWMSRLQYEILNQGSGEEVTPLAQAALRALGAATAEAQFKEAPSQEKVLEWRAKIDRLTELSESQPFLAEQERAFIRTLKTSYPSAVAVEQATRLLAHPDKRVAEMAKEELSLIEIARQPLELTFTALDGKTVELAALRGRLVYFVFWATTNEQSVEDLLEILYIANKYRGEKIDIIAVSYDTAENKAAVEKFVKAKWIKCPVWYTGTGMNNEFGAKVGVKWLPGTALFDEKGLFVSNSVGRWQFEDQLIKRLNISRRKDI